MITTKALSHLNTLESKIPIWIKDAIFENAEAIINLLQSNQLSKGVDATGTVVGRYSWATDVFWTKDPYNKPRKEKQAGSPYNFEWSGELFDSMNIKVNSQKSIFDIYSVTGRDKEIEGIFNKDLMHLTKENNDWVNLNIIEPYLSKKISENLFVF